MEETGKGFGQTQAAIWIGAGLVFGATLCLSSHLWLSADYRLEFRVLELVSSTENDPAGWFRSSFFQFLGLGFLIALAVYNRLVKPRFLRFKVHVTVVALGILGAVVWPSLFLPNTWTDQSGVGLLQMSTTLLGLAPVVAWIVLAFAVYAAGYFYVFKPILNREAQIHRLRGRDE